jgi:transcriptional regulator with XRE-family HTH domain
MDMSPSDLKALGKLIARTRTERDLTRDVVASAAGLAESSLKRLEDGEFKRPDPDKLQRIARALALDAEDLFALAGYTPSDGLPGFGPYLRTKFGKELPAPARKKLERYFEQVREEHGKGGRGGSAR